MLLADYNSVGLTSVAERDASPGDVELYRTLRQRNELTCRVFLNAHIDPADSWEKVQGQILKAAGMSFDNVVSSRVYITDGTRFQEMNKTYQTYFTKDPPARATVIAPLMGPPVGSSMTT